MDAVPAILLAQAMYMLAMCFAQATYVYIGAWKDDLYSYIL